MRAFSHLVFASVPYARSTIPTGVKRGTAANRITVHVVATDKDKHGTYGYSLEVVDAGGMVWMQICADGAPTWALVPGAAPRHRLYFQRPAIKRDGPVYRFARG